jgi:MFS family permease
MLESSLLDQGGGSRFMRFNPILSIILGAFVIIVALLSLVGILGAPNLNNNFIGSIFFVTVTLILVLGGFIATYFAKESENKIWYGYKIRYAIYLGIILAAIETIAIGHTLIGYQGIGIATGFFVIFSLITGFGGFIAKMTEKNNRQQFKSKLINNEFKSIIAVVVGFVVASACAALLELILGINSATTTYGIIDFVIGAISLIIGGFVTLFLVKEKKIQYGFYVGIIAILVGILKLYAEIVSGLVINESYYIRVGVYVGYFLFAGLGGYLGILLANYKLKNNK